jgi:cytochrome c oxidase subunit 1/cytochrome c oxidase subunit I+III
MLLHWWSFTGLMILSCVIALMVWMWPEKALAQRSPASPSREAHV